jgi:hypothetical protein
LNVVALANASESNVGILEFVKEKVTLVAGKPDAFTDGFLVAASGDDAPKFIGPCSDVEFLIDISEFGMEWLVIGPGDDVPSVIDGME